MSRSLHASTSSYIGNETVSPRIMFKAMFDTPLYLWTGDYDITYDSNTYQGSGGIIGLDNIEETSDLGATGITLSMAISSNDITSDLLTRAVTEDYQGNSIILYLALVNPLNTPPDLIGDPIVLFDGFIDLLSVEDDGDQATISLTAESSLLRLGRAYPRRYTDEDQKYHFAGDKGLEFVTAIQEENAIWGSNS
jgi:hypothetical protein